MQQPLTTASAPEPAPDATWHTLPLLRDVQEYAAQGPELARELVAVYPDRLVLLRHHREAPIPVAAGEPGGYSALASLPTKARRSTSRGQT